MADLRLHVLSLRYSSWSMRAYLALRHAGADFQIETAQVELGKQNSADTDAAGGAALLAQQLTARRKQGSVTGLWPVLHVDSTPIHEALSIVEWVNEAFPAAQLWPVDGLMRARARSVSCEMASGFTQMRTHMSCHLFGRVPTFTPNPATQAEITRVFELWSDALTRSGGPFLFGSFSGADVMYYPIRTRLRTYGVPVPEALAAYVAALDALPAVADLAQLAHTAPRVPVYDTYVRELGGDPDAGL